jgi:hypothetical protein
LEEDAGTRRPGKQIDAARHDLRNARTELQGSIATTHEITNELVLLEKKGEPSYYEFDIDESGQFRREGQVGIRLQKANAKRDYANLTDPRAVQAIARCAPEVPGTQDRRKGSPSSKTNGCAVPVRGPGGALRGGEGPLGGSSSNARSATAATHLQSGIGITGAAFAVTLSSKFLKKSGFSRPRYSLPRLHGFPGSTVLDKTYSK